MKRAVTTARRRRWFARAATGFAVALLAACSDEEPLTRREAFVFGTRVEISVWGVPETQAAPAMDTVLRDFDALHRRYHPWQPGPMADLNRALATGQTTPVDAQDTQLVADLKRWHSASSGLFNPALGQLVALWGFHADDPRPSRPDPRDIERLTRAHPSPADLLIEHSRLRSRNPVVQLDLGGYAKGWALDRAAASLRAAGIRDALINIGGNVIVLGRRGARPWRVGIQHPREPGVLTTVDLRDGEAIGTSGDYQRFYEIDGARMAHILDPRSGRPARVMQSVTVIAPPGPQAGRLSEVATKPLFIDGPAHFSEHAARLGVRLALGVGAHGQRIETPAMRERLGERASGH